MKKTLMTLAAVLCCAMTMTVLTSCTKDKDKFVYTIKAEPGGLMNGIEAGNWRNSVMSVYQAALGTDSEEFTKHGSQEECDHEVLEERKKAEMSLNVGGTGDVMVFNNTVNRLVYRRSIQ